MTNSINMHTKLKIPTYTTRIFNLRLFLISFDKPNESELKLMTILLQLILFFLGNILLITRFFTN